MNYRYVFVWFIFLFDAVKNHNEIHEQIMNGSDFWFEQIFSTSCTNL